MKLHLPYLSMFFSILASIVFSYILSTPEIPLPKTSLVGPTLIVLAIFLGYWAKQALSIHATAISPYGKPSTLVSSGPFKFSRNPMYLSYVLIAIGVAIHIQSLVAFIPPFIYFLYLDKKIVPNEEKALLASFPDFETYSQKVRKWA